MKFISEFKELNGRVFNSINECKEAENVILKEREALAEKERDKSKLKKKLSGEIDKAEEALKEAYAAYDAAKEKARIELEESNKRISDILNTAKEAVKAAEAARAAAILNFNEQCGPYQKVYTEQEAQDEFNRFTKQFNSLFSDIFKYII